MKGSVSQNILLLQECLYCAALKGRPSRQWSDNSVEQGDSQENVRRTFFYFSPFFPPHLHDSFADSLTVVHLGNLCFGFFPYSQNNWIVAVSKEDANNKSKLLIIVFFPIWRENKQFLFLQVTWLHSLKSSNDSRLIFSLMNSMWY